MEFHEYANIYRMLPDNELQSLADDIKAKGQLLPITSYEGKILDGRNRFRACAIAGLQPRIEEYTGNDPIGLIASLNDHRRHDTANERALVGARMANLKNGQRAASMGAGGKTVVTIERAAELSGSSRKNIERAKPIVQNGIPELEDMVNSNKVSIRTGSEVAKLPQEEQRKAVAGGVEGVKEAAKKLASETRQPEPQSSDQASQNKRQPPLKIAHAMGIFAVARNHMDKIAKNDKERIQALNSMIEYCQSRISNNQ